MSKFLRNNLLRPWIFNSMAFVLIMTLQCHGQFNDEYDVVTVLNSYHGKIDHLLVKYRATLSHPNPPTNLKRKLKLEAGQFCAIPVVENVSSITNHDFLAQNRPWCQSLSHSPELKHKLDSLSVTFHSLGAQKALNLDKSSLDELVSLGARKRLLTASFLPESHYFLDERIRRLSSLEYTGDVKLENWLSNQDKIVQDLFDSLVELYLEYNKTIDEVYLNVFRTRNECPPVFSNVTRYCASDPTCVANIENWLTASWIQDYYYALEPSTASGLKSFAIRNDLLTDRNSPIQAAGSMARCVCHTGPMMLPQCDIQGGSMIIADRFIIIGRDELEMRYLDTASTSVRERLTQFGINWNKLTKKEIELKVTQSLEYVLSNGTKTILWFGLEEKRARFHSYTIDSSTIASYRGHAPMYHLDLSMMLLGTRFNDSNVYHCLLAKPNIEFQNLKGVNSRSKQAMYVTVVDSLVLFTDTCFRKLQQDLISKLGVQLEAITVPMPLVIKDDNSELETIASFANGLVESYKSGIHCYLPDYSAAGNILLRKETKYGKSLTIVKRQLSKQGIKLTFIKSTDFKRLAGLHCNVNVFSRKN
ncbi:MAG: hypothetical protein K9J17_02755 [Flavobacteriales bacterium]|nr:hypothetical protein [Flavobacteriales bacterium]